MKKIEKFISKLLDGVEKENIRQLKRVWTSGILMWLPILGILFGFREVYFWFLCHYSIWDKWNWSVCFLNGAYQAGWVLLIAEMLLN